MRAQCAAYVCSMYSVSSVCRNALNNFAKEIPFPVMSVWLLVRRYGGAEPGDRTMVIAS